MNRGERLKPGQESIGIGRIISRVKEKDIMMLIWMMMLSLWKEVVEWVLIRKSKDVKEEGIIIVFNLIRKDRVIYSHSLLLITKIQIIRRLHRVIDLQIFLRHQWSKADLDLWNQTILRKEKRLKIQIRSRVVFKDKHPHLLLTIKDLIIITTSQVVKNTLVDWNREQIVIMQSIKMVIRVNIELNGINLKI